MIRIGGGLTSTSNLVHKPAFHPTTGAAQAERFKIMSMHPSVKAATKITAKRNVLKRFERIDVLKSQGKWRAGERALGLPKTKPPV